MYVFTLPHSLPTDRSLQDPTTGFPWRLAVMLLAILMPGSPAIAQMMSNSSGASGSSRAVQLPASGRNGESGSVATQQTPGVSGTGTVSSSVQVNGNYAGSLPSSSVPNGPVSISLEDAIKRGLAANLGTITANNSVRAARAGRVQQLSALLPNISANASETVTQVNLAAYGFQFNVPPNFGFSIPSVVGPFSYSQLQGALSQSVFDLVQRRNYQASKESERAAGLSAKDSREVVVLAVAGTYLQVQAAAARLDSQRAQVKAAQAVYDQATTRKVAGTNSKLDVTRSLVELQTEQQRLASFESDLRKQKIALARILGLPLDRELTLTEALGFRDVTTQDASVIVQEAFARRSDLQASETQVKAAERALQAAKAERLPSVSLNGDYGVLGPNPANTHGVFAITGAVNVPIWQGGRVKGDIQQAEATLAQRQAELADQRVSVEQDVRDALVDLQTASGQVKLAQTNRSYANQTLEQATDRFTAGVATTVEVVQAQEQLASAENDYISSLFSFNLARLALARAQGQAETDSANLLKGTQP
jgi:outer membrane protein TolC